MKITGTRIEREDVEVEVNPNAFVKLVRRKLAEKYSILAPDTSIQDGNVYAYTSDGFIGTDKYEKIRKATQEDYRVVNAFKNFKSAFLE